LQFKNGYPLGKLPEKVVVRKSRDPCFKTTKNYCLKSTKSPRRNSIRHQAQHGRRAGCLFTVCQGLQQVIPVTDDKSS